MYKMLMEGWMDGWENSKKYIYLYPLSLSQYVRYRKNIFLCKAKMYFIRFHSYTYTYSILEKWVHPHITAQKTN